MGKELKYTGNPAAAADGGKLLKKFPELPEQGATGPARQYSRGTERGAKTGGIISGILSFIKPWQGL